MGIGIWHPSRRRKTERWKAKTRYVFSPLFRVNVKYIPGTPYICIYTFLCTTAMFLVLSLTSLKRYGMVHTTGRYSTAPFTHWYYGGARVILFAFSHRDVSCTSSLFLWPRAMCVHFRKMSYQQSEKIISVYIRGTVIRLTLGWVSARSFTHRLCAYISGKWAINNVRRSSPCIYEALL